MRFNEATGFIVVCPITSKKKGYPFEVSLPAECIVDDKGYPITGVILTDQVKSLDWKAHKIKIIKKYNIEDPQISIINSIIDECLAKIETFLSK